MEKDVAVEPLEKVEGDENPGRVGQGRTIVGAVASRQMLAGIVLATASALISLAGLEFLLRMTGIVPRSDPAPGLFAPDPGVGYRMVSHYTGMYLKSGRWFSVSTNAQGFRDRADFTAPTWGPQAPRAWRVLVRGVRSLTVAARIT